MVYQWREGSHINVPAQPAGEFLERIRKNNQGMITPALVVSEARPKASPLHNAFEWDDTAASRKYREDQARHLIGAIVTVIQPRTGGAEITTRAFVNLGVGDEGDRAYMGIREVLAKPALRTQMVNQALRELRCWQDRYRQYRELASIMDAIDLQKSIAWTEDQAVTTGRKAEAATVA